MAKTRCSWAGDDPLSIEYHDVEWGRPVHRDRKLFEFLVLEGAQAGLSWMTILRKRPGYRRLFAGFDPEEVARFDRRRIDSLLGDPSIVRNRAKVTSAIDNAKVFLDLREEFGTFNRFIWRFVDGRPKVNGWRTMKQVPAETEQSQAMSKELRRRGMRFVGPTICYAFMQAVGMVNDHTTDCFRHRQLVELGKPRKR